MKRCSRCKEWKDESEYTSVTSGYCAECAKAYRRERYIPVGEQAAKRREVDAAWRAKHDAKTCVVCKRKGSETLFRRLAHKRCSECMAKSLWWCPVHGVIRKPRCQKCRYQKILKRQAEAAERRKAKAQAQVFLVNGDGTCPRCGKLIRIRGKIDRTHQCQ
jgi:hypothetical protein